MPIRTDCSSCGKKLRIRDDLIGKKVKCPACGKAFLAEAAGDDTAVTAAPQKPPAASKATDKVAAKPMAKKPPPPEEDEDEEEIEERPVRRGKKSQKKALPLNRKWVLAGAGALLIVVLVAVYFLFLSGPAKTTGPVALKKKNPAPVKEEVTLADLVPGDAWFFVSDAETPQSLAWQRKLSGPAFDQEFQKNLGFTLSDVERMSVFPVAEYGAFKNSPVPPLVVVVQGKKPFSKKAVTTALQNGELGKNTKFVADFVSDQVLLLAPADVLPAYHSKKGKVAATGVLERALTRASTSPGMVASVDIPAEALKDAEAALKNVPQLSKIRAVFLTFDMTDRLALHVALTAEDAASAQEIKTAADGLVGLASLFLNQSAKDPQMAPLVKTGQKALKDLKLDVKDKEMTLAFQMDTTQAMGMVMGTVMPAIEKIRGAAGDTVGMNNLKQIGLAWHTYHDAHGSFPPQTFNKGLSWRVAILPFIEQEALYKQFKLNEPWDSPHNIKLLPLMPKVYESAAGSGRGTYFQTFVGPKTINKTPTQGIKLTQISDGASNTLIVAEGMGPVAWTKPEDITIAPDTPVRLGGEGPQILALFADASVQRLPRTLDQQTLRWLIDPADGNPIPNFSAPGTGKK